MYDDITSLQKIFCKEDNQSGDMMKIPQDNLIIEVRN